MTWGQAHQIRWIEAIADTNIPAFGLVEIVGAVWQDPGRTCVRVDKPSADSCSPIAINSWKPIASGQHGLVTFDGPTWVLYNGSPSTGDIWGPKEDSFEAEPNQTGLIVLGGSTGDQLLVDFYGGAGSNWVIGKVSGGAIGAGSTGTVQRYDELWQATSTYATVINPHEVELPNGLRVRWGSYPGWQHLVVEPFDYTECE